MKVKTKEIKITPAMITTLKKFGRLGLTRYQVAAYFGYYLTQWEKIEEQYPEIVTALGEGRSSAIVTMTQKVYDKAMDGDWSAIVYWLKYAAGWNETGTSLSYEAQKPKESKISPLVLTVNDPIEAARIYQQIMAGS